MSRLRRLSITLALVAALAAGGCGDDESGGSSGSGGAADPSIEYTGQFDGQPTALTLVERAGMLSGQLDIGGYLYEVDGRDEGASISGELTDREKGGVLPFRATKTDAGLDLIMKIRGRETTIALALKQPPAPDAPGVGGPLAGNPPAAPAMGGPLGPGNQNTTPTTPPPGPPGVTTPPWNPATPTPTTPTTPTTPAGTTDDRWSGTWTGTVNGQQATLALKLNGTNLSGTLSDATGQMNLAGTVNGVRASGQLTMQQLPQPLTWQGAVVGDTLRMTVDVINPATGQKTPTPFTFTRGGANAGPGNVGAAPGNDVNVQRDPAVIGTWRYTSMVSVPGYSSAGDIYLKISADGNYRYGDQRFVASHAGGGTDVQSTDAQTGQWRTEGGKVYVKPTGTAQWVLWAQYEAQAQYLMFIYTNGNKQLFDRV